MTFDKNTLYSVVLDGPHGEAADALRYFHAQEALEDSQWRDVYDRVVDGPLGFPENLPSVTHRLRVIPQGSETDPNWHLLGVPWSSLADCAGLLEKRAEQLGVPRTNTPIPTDLVAAAVGSHVWCAALGVDDVTRAASLGHDATSSISAIMARAIGEGQVFTALVPAGETHPVYGLEYLDRVIDLCHARASSTLGEDGAKEALRLAAHDLSYRASGGSMTYQAALRLRDYLTSLQRNGSQTKTGHPAL